MLNELRDLDFNDIGSAPTSVRYVILGFLLVVILAIGYFLLIKAKTEQLEMVQGLENQLRVDFEAKQAKAANLESYEAQLAEMQELLETMFRQLPSKTEMDKLLVDVSQTALGAGIDVQLFQPNAEAYHDFYAERPISVRMLGDYHQFGEFVSGVASLPRVVTQPDAPYSSQAPTCRSSRSASSATVSMCPTKLMTGQYLSVNRRLCGRQ